MVIFAVLFLVVYFVIFSRKKFQCKNKNFMFEFLIGMSTLAFSSYITNLII